MSRDRATDHRKRASIVSPGFDAGRFSGRARFDPAGAEKNRPSQAMVRAQAFCGCAARQKYFAVVTSTRDQAAERSWRRGLDGSFAQTFSLPNLGSTNLYLAEPRKM